MDLGGLKGNVCMKFSKVNNMLCLKRKQERLHGQLVHTETLSQKTNEQKRAKSTFMDKSLKPHTKYIKSILNLKEDRCVQEIIL